MPNYWHWKVDRLKQELRERGAKLTGKKAELIDRLESYDRNDNFRGEEIVLPEANPMPDFPPLSSFRSLTLGDRSVCDFFSVPHIIQAKF